MKPKLTLRLLAKWRSVLPPAWRFARAMATGGVRRGLYEPEGELEAPGGLGAPVKIRRDKLGIPYISAQSWPDAALAIGFCHGCDRLAQLELMRRLPAGRLAEAIGRLALPLDVAARIIGYRRLAEDYQRRIDGETHELLAAYAKGVSEAIARRIEARRLPVEYAIFNFTPQPWTVLDSLVISRCACTDVNLAVKPLMTMVAQHTPEPLRRLILPSVPWPPGQPAAPPPREHSSWGSNAWAVGASRSADGKPIVAADPHVGIQAPCLWYAARVAVERTDETVAGLTVPGWPFFVLGRSRRVAWAATNMLADTADLFWEKLDRESYVVDGNRRPLSFHREEISIRGGRKVTIRVRRTHRGPVISDSALLRGLLGAPPGVDVSLAWPAESIDSDELSAMYRINRAKTLGDFAEAVRRYGLCALNFIAADADGHIGQFPAAALPIRTAPPEGVIYDGTKSSHDWQGTAFPSPLTSCTDPAEGFLANSNDLYPPVDDAAMLGPLTCPPYRGRRLRSLLAEAQGMTAEDAAKIQGDCLCLFTRDLAGKLAGMLGPSEGRAPRRAQEMLRNFDGRMEADSASAAVAGIFVEFFRLRLFVLLLGPRAGSRFAGAYQSFPATLRIIESAGEGGAISTDKLSLLASAAFNDAVKYLLKRHGRRPERWQWGRVLRVAPATPLRRVPLLGRRFNLPPTPARGSANAVNQVRFRFRASGKSLNAYLGVTARLIMPLGNDSILACVGTGQNENPSSRHFQDQYGMLHNGQYAEITLSELPQESSESSVVLRPAEHRT